MVEVEFEGATAGAEVEGATAVGAFVGTPVGAAVGIGVFPGAAVGAPVLPLSAELPLQMMGKSVPCRGARVATEYHRSQPTTTGYNRVPRGRNRVQPVATEYDRLHTSTLHGRQLFPAEAIPRAAGEWRRLRTPRPATVGPPWHLEPRECLVHWDQDDFFWKAVSVLAVCREDRLMSGGRRRVRLQLPRSRNQACRCRR